MKFEFVEDENEKKVFRPFSMVIETEEEANFMWWILHCDTRESLEEHLKEGKIHLRRNRDTKGVRMPFVLDGAHFGLWSDFDDMFRPKGR